MGGCAYGEFVVLQRSAGCGGWECRLLMSVNRGVIHVKLDEFDLYNVHVED